jgi:hypothetical protein
MNVLPAASAAAVLAWLILASPGSPGIDASSTAGSTPPARPLEVDVGHGTLGGLGLGRPASEYIRRLGVPDFVGQVETPGVVEMLWSRSADPTSGWATATLRSSRSTRIEQVRFSGLFSTARGDRRGTPLATFLRHWRSYAPRVVGVRGRRGAVEYNVVVGMVVFGFGAAKTLQAVGLAAGSAAPMLCVIPTACVVPRLS